MRLDDLPEQLITLGLAAEATITPCTPAEVDEVRASHGVDTLSEPYERFLLLMGRGAGELLRGTDIYYPTALNLAEYTEEYLAENDVAHLFAPGSIVVAMHQGYHVSWIEPSGVVHENVEPDTTIHKTWPGMADWLLTYAQAQRASRDRYRT
ncbi:hypothetical protein EV193_102786 [Herbihabitans rhizosphaerae]|uniref:SUKH superfamily protein n=1 Tax=Herbihabitans rhizosphaerae TaxID=1872711 RepID=A0A4Q7L3I8_9PSEU|nr:hypothetical protein [Herbihabitans rhizosphaerae]RZS43805.1 hypothetical protein EV193_102786 [Herbihabitans rhizosphaerae]